jgi:hypothetical protein
MSWNEFDPSRTKTPWIVRLVLTGCTFIFINMALGGGTVVGLKLSGFRRFRIDGEARYHSQGIIAACGHRCRGRVTDYW